MNEGREIVSSRLENVQEQCHVVGIITSFVYDAAQVNRLIEDRTKPITSGFAKSFNPHERLQQQAICTVREPQRLACPGVEHLHRNARNRRQRILEYAKLVDFGREPIKR